MEEMKNYICINGKKAELTEEQLKALGIELSQKSPFERVEYEEKYYFIYGNGAVNDCLETRASFDKEAFNCANYCTDKAIMEQRALHETLYRLLWRYSMEHKAKDKTTPFGIYYNREYNEWNVIYTHEDIWYLGAPRFDNKTIAIQAIEEIVKPFMEAHPEFKL